MMYGAPTYGVMPRQRPRPPGAFGTPLGDNPPRMQQPPRPGMQVPPGQPAPFEAPRPGRQQITPPAGLSMPTRRPYQLAEEIPFLQAGTEAMQPQIAELWANRDRQQNAMRPAPPPWWTELMQYR